MNMVCVAARPPLKGELTVTIDDLTHDQAWEIIDALRRYGISNSTISLDTAEDIAERESDREVGGSDWPLVVVCSCIAAIGGMVFMALVHAFGG